MSEDEGGWRKDEPGILKLKYEKRAFSQLQDGQYDRELIWVFMDQTKRKGETNMKNKWI